ncbi:MULTISPECIES: hypothetical protein [Photorhabdus]|uniref:hypothetical protein n=1 Tax=Photorhabdus TaxID=29487 RepID=UPI000DCB4367|nr:MULTISPECIES: hypothetical protein [Photorhabdus]MCT8345122.1 hypothetical protein [Photorhabdus kleinii]RAW91467.1 hypothetical protein CKY05_23995 [Photorhabdus sp. S10-54]RAW91602.1 hypothetical protein CKY03_23995 [Photorhabdus sp. S9-53]RAW95116.1 hypothetical protein CKY04_24075 [Photorhabdus sp. S8-52]
MNETKEMPIIFNSEMVRAILDGRKTQTRRIVKRQYISHKQELRLCDDGYFYWWMKDAETHQPRRVSCPFGKTGDRLWVRETFQGPFVDYNDSHDLFKNPESYQKPENCIYRADCGQYPSFYDADDNLRQGWRAAIHMPRWASRITLEITDIRVERLNEISEEDAIAEGCYTDDEYGFNAQPRLWPCQKCQGDQTYAAYANGVYYVDCRECDTAKKRFKLLWESIYGFNSFDNKRVWVIEFKIIEKR